jgi:hypothetical protein
MLMMVLSILFSMFSTGMMSYLAMNEQLGPWVAPVFVVVCMVLMMPFFNKQWFKEHVVVTIAAGSVGGMVGMCLGLTLPSVYLLHKAFFLKTFQQSWLFAFLIMSFVLIAGALALTLAYTLRHLVIYREQARFPMSRLVHDVVYAPSQNNVYISMLAGISLATIWNFFGMVARSAMLAYAPQIQMMPLLISIGFVAGKVIAPAILLGLITKTVVIELLRTYSAATISEHAFLITFCSGMLIAWMCRTVFNYSIGQNAHEVTQGSYWLHKIKDKRYAFCFILSCLFSGVFLFLLGTPLLGLVYILLSLMWLALSMSRIVGEIGIIEVDSYVWFVLLPLIYFLSPTSLCVVVVAVFATLCLGLVVDAMFSYKLAQLSDVSYPKILKYQIVACVAAAVAAGLFFLWYGNHFEAGSLALAVPKAHDLADMIQFGRYDYFVLFCGLLYGIVVSVATSELLVVTGAVLMLPVVSAWLILIGAIAHLVPHRERLYPICFGVYAGHSLWLMMRAFL